MALHPDSARQCTSTVSTASWRRGLPVLTDDVVTLRELTVKDACALVAHLNTASVRRHLSPPPASVAGFRRFVRWTQAQRRRGSLACFAIVPHGSRDAVGIVQVWRIESDFATAEWGIAVGEAWWGRGVAQAAARLLFQFAFATLEANRLEARTVVSNQRGRNLMIRLGAVQEGTLRHSFRRGDATEHQELWAFFAPDL